MGQKWFWFGLFFGVVLIVRILAYEPQLRCYDCIHCATNYKHTAKHCDPRVYFCVYLEKPNEVINRYCGIAGNCSALLEKEGDGNCSMCSAHLCNDMYYASQAIPAVSGLPFTYLLVAFVCLFIA